MTRLRVRARRVIAAGHHDHDLRLGGRARASQETVCEGSPASAEHVLAAGQLDQLRRPVARHVHGVEPLERRHARAGRPRTASRDPLDPLLGVAHERDALRAVARGLGERRTSPSVSPSVFGSSAITRGRDGQPAGQLGDLLVGDRAHRAQRLRDDQLGLERGERLAVELVDRLALQRALAHRRVDLRRR